VQLRLYALDVTDDPAAWRSHVQATSWWVIASRGPSADRAWTKRFDELTRLVDAQRSDVVVALFGPAEIADAWRAYGGPTPCAVASEPGPILRAVTGDFLRRVRPP
jgi:hypothetical protein